MRTANPDNIVRIKNFLSDKELSEFINFFDNHYFFNDPKVTERALVTVDPGHDVFDTASIYVDNVCKKISQHFGSEVIDFSGTCFRKWYPGEFQPAHSDCEANIYVDGLRMKCDPYYNFSSIFLEYGSLCYLNDNYEGGEIFFPDYELSIKPECNELIFFPGTKFYMHGVEEVTSGNRLVVQNFLTSTKLRYIWEKFVQGEEALNFIDYSQEEMFSNKIDFNRSNLPYNCPHKLPIYN